MKEGFYMDDARIIIDYTSLYCDTPEKLLRSEVFNRVVSKYIRMQLAKESPVLEMLMRNLSHEDMEDFIRKIVLLLRLLQGYQRTEILSINPLFSETLASPDLLHQFVEGLYDFWRKFERYLILTAPHTRLRTRESIHHATFIRSNETLKELILRTYRTIIENLNEKNPFRIYRQLPSGGQVGLFTQHIEWQIPQEYMNLKKIPFIRLALLDPPVIFYPSQNKRSGLFQETKQNPITEFEPNPDEWYCYPAKIGDLLAFAYFHQDFMSLGTSLVNLFEIAQFEDIYQKKPDIILIFGANPLKFTDELTVFYQDDCNEIMIGYEVHHPKIDYFGYVKKMLLTLHNIRKINQKSLPVHGAMVSIRLKNKKMANVIIVGDSGAGKSETLEAFRILAADYLNEMTIIFDDMGSVRINEKGELLAFGTEIGAFLRLDDLQPGFAYEQIDRSIFMNPHLTNARLIVPVTTYANVMKGTPFQYFLYANNYEQVKEGMPYLRFFSSVEEALPVFKKGKRRAKGTTSEVGIVESYFANPFGAPQRFDHHESIARFYFERFFQAGIKVGEIYTQLGIEGMEMSGPERAARALFRDISEN